MQTGMIRRVALTVAALVTATMAHAVAKVGRPAPRFTLTTFAGDKVALADLRGQVVLLNHWATWCGPCRAELPAMDAYYRRHRGEGLRMFAVTGEDSVPRRLLQPLAAVLAIPLSNRFQGNAYGPIGGMVPSSYVIDRAGVVRYAKSGAFDAESLDAILRPLLAEPAPPPAHPAKP
jgi:peroxiredoxin